MTDPRDTRIADLDRKASAVRDALDHGGLGGLSWHELSAESQERYRDVVRHAERGRDLCIAELATANARAAERIAELEHFKTQHEKECPSRTAILTAEAEAAGQIALRQIAEMRIAELEAEVGRLTSSLQEKPEPWTPTEGELCTGWCSSVGQVTGRYVGRYAVSMAVLRDDNGHCSIVSRLEKAQSPTPPAPAAREECGIPSRTLGPCDDEWGHEGDMHSSAGDGFYARDHTAEHQRRQALRKEKEKPPEAEEPAIVREWRELAEQRQRSIELLEGSVKLHREGGEREVQTRLVMQKQRDEFIEEANRLRAEVTGLRGVYLERDRLREELAEARLAHGEAVAYLQEAKRCVTAYSDKGVTTPAAIENNIEHAIECLQPAHMGAGEDGKVGT